MCFKVNKVIILFISLLVSLYAQAGWLNSIIQSVPGKPAEGVRDYLDMVGLNPEASRNIDIGHYNANLMKQNPCIRTLAAQFYSSLDAQGFANEFSMETLKKPLSHQVALSETAESIGLESGWLWKEALKVTKGNKTLALQIIGLCGHDDKFQMDGYSFPLTDKQRESLVQAASKMSPDVKKMLIQKIVDHYIQSYVEPPSESKKQELILKANEDFSKGISFENGALCPSKKNPMFYPRSLSATADIPDDLKKKIAAIQAPSVGPEYLPAKSYHVMGSASLSCVLLRKGVPEFAAKKIITNAVNAYRATRLCQSIKESQETMDERISPSSALALVKEVRKNQANCEKFDDTKKARDCTAITKILGKLILQDKDISDALIEEKFVRGLARADATNMFFRSWRSLLANKCDGLQVTSALKDYFKSNGLSGNKNPCDKKTNPDRCTNSRKVMDEWAIDFEWSEASQLAGFNFAKQNCERVDSIQTLENQACKISEEEPVTQGHTSDQKAGVN